MAFLTEGDVLDYIRGICFKTGPPGRVGGELEWLVVDTRDPKRAVPIDLVSGLLHDARPLPAGSAISYEPGGQLELSSLPQEGPAAAHAALASDLAHLESRLDAAGLALRGAGLDPCRPPVRQLDLPRYTAMEAYFDADGPSGRIMMRSTASVQVCVDVGNDPADAERRWWLTHRLEPVLTAAFANSALWRGRPTGWRCSRQVVWAAIDPSRTRTAYHLDPAGGWAEYALDARLMAIRRDSDPWIVNPGLRFRDWIADGHGCPPTLDDLAFHLSTLFPPVRPRGWLELRMIDAQPREWWPVPMAVVAALVDDPVAADIAAAETEKLHSETLPERLWLHATRDALTDRRIARCARACFEAAHHALPRMGATDLAPVVDAYCERFIERGRCPADEQLDRGRV